MGDTEELPVGPQPGVKYPILVQYCGNCSMPFEFCEYYPDFDSCKKWLSEKLPEQFEKLGTGRPKARRGRQTRRKGRREVVRE